MCLAPKCREFASFRRWLFEPAPKNVLKGTQDVLFHQALIPEYQFRLHWEPHTIAVWDNRSTQHYAIHDYYPQRRYMERVTIRGDAVIGVERADPATVRRAKYVAPKNVDVHGGHKPH